jgi:uncharacterized membrane protein YeaQ/YmgE (transglycosylase-associated protein family)
MLRILILLLIGVVIGALTSYFGQRDSGACALTTTWWCGAIYGGAIGLFVSWTSYP